MKGRGADVSNKPQQSACLGLNCHILSTFPMKNPQLLTLVTTIISLPVFADEAMSLHPMTEMVVTATRIEERSFDLPVAIDLVEKNDIQNGQLQMTLSESLIRVPGVTAQNRTQMAQDPQISTRGFGARSTFGVRGVRLYVDDIPLTMPDGIGQPGNVDLGAIRAIEVMRGPFSSLYGSSSGGVIQLFTENAPKTPEVGAGLFSGSYGTTKESTRATGAVNGIEYLLNYSNHDTDGYRQQSKARKEQATAKLKFNLGERTRVTLLANWIGQNAQDPLGSRRTAALNLLSDGHLSGYVEPSAFASPQAVPTSATAANTRVSRTNTQAGINLKHQLDENNTLNLISYLGHRDNLQFLSLSTTSSSGRVSQISRDFWGSEVRWANKGQLLNRDYAVTAGIAYGTSSDDRTDVSATNGIKNPISATSLNRNENDKASNFDQYIQAKWAALKNVDLHLGIRNTLVRFEIQDYLADATQVFISNKYRDGTGHAGHRQTTSVIGLVWRANPALNLYANYGKGFETPTLIEIAYGGSDGSGPNLGLKPSTSDNYEAGLKAFIADNARLNLAVFKTNTKQEIVLASSGAYSVYGNAGKTSRKGVELSAGYLLEHNICLYGAYTYLDAKYDTAFSEYKSDTTSVLTPSGKTIPGTYRTQFYGEVSWKHPGMGFTTAFEGRHNSKVHVDDVNSDSAPAYTLYNLRAGFEQIVTNWRLTEYARVENIFDKNYIGSVRVNDSNARFFEAAAGRNWLIGLNATFRF